MIVFHTCSVLWEDFIKYFLFDNTVCYKHKYPDLNILQSFILNFPFSLNFSNNARGN
jgi:hypothetical protein